MYVATSKKTMRVCCDNVWSLSGERCVTIFSELSLQRFSGDEEEMKKTRKSQIKEEVNSGRQRKEEVRGT